MLERINYPFPTYDTTSPIGLFGNAYHTVKELIGCDDFVLFSCSVNDLDFEFSDFFKSSYCKKIKPIPIKIFNSEININLVAKNQLSFGIFEYEIINIGSHINKNDPPRFWTFFDGEGHSWYGHFVAVRKKDCNNFYRFFKKNEKSKYKVVEAPILPRNILNDVYENSIAFLKRGSSLFEQYNKYKIPIKRGILLSGNPGSGKTLTCKWIKHLATKNNLLSKVVTVDAYTHAIQQKNLKSLFEFGNSRRRSSKKQSGIIFFDDMDMLFKDRETGNTDVYNFLTHLDGIEPTEGVVYIFTTNLIKELDPAFVRPGRIDLFHVFKNPGAALRGQFISELFHDDIKSQINVGKLIEDTDDYSFAELEEIRKLLCIDQISGVKINLEKTMALFKKHRSDFTARLGFKTISSYDDDDNEPAYPFEPNWM